MSHAPSRIADRIAADPEILGGKPAIKGTRIPVALVLDYLANNPSFAELFADYPELTMADVQACLDYGQALADPLWTIVGMIKDAGGPTDVSANVDQYLAEAYLDTHGANAE